MQSTVNVYQCPGIPGDAFDASPRRALSVQVVPNSTVQPVVGTYCTYVSAGTDPALVTVGGTGTPAGLLVNGKEYVRQGGLSASLTVSSGAVVAVADMGRYWIKAENAVTVGNVAAFDSATGTISAFATSAAATSGGYIVIPGAEFVAVNATSGGMAVIQLG